jgi:cyclopentanol dehydrogenase
MGVEKEGEKMNRLQGKVAFITGAAGGIGAGIARLFASEGAKVVLAGRTEKSLRKVADEIQELGGEALPLTLDVSSEHDWHNAVDKIIEHYGALHILINNAAILQREGIEETTLEMWEKVQETNTRSVFLGMKHAALQMKKSDGGSIINMSSIYGIVGTGRYAAYHASKGAIRLLTKTAALEFAKDRIRVNSIHPGFIQTPLNKDSFANKKTLEQFQELTPWPHLGLPEDVAYGALYLASDESTFVTGTELMIDGGYTAR